MDTTSKQQKLPGRVKNTIFKISKFIISRALYFVLGICVAVAISVAYAAVSWPTPLPTVSSGDPLTSSAWNNFIDSTNNLNTRVTTLEAGGNNWTSEHSGCYTHTTGAWNTWVDCAAGYAVTGVWFAGAGVTHGSVRCCKLR